jgi:hypothetical protein
MRMSASRPPKWTAGRSQTLFSCGRPLLLPVNGYVKSNLHPKQTQFLDLAVPRGLLRPVRRPRIQTKPIPSGRSGHAGLLPRPRRSDCAKQSQTWTEWGTWGMHQGGILCETKPIPGELGVGRGPSCQTKPISGTVGGPGLGGTNKPNWAGQSRPWRAECAKQTQFLPLCRS